MDLIDKGRKLSSVYTLADALNESCGEMDIRGVSHRGYFAAMTDLKSYFDANEELLDRRKARELFHEEWTVYTRTNDSCPTQYFEGSNVKSSVISNGCLIEGMVENSIIGRGCEIRKGAVVRNCVVNADVVIGKDVHVENMVIDKHAKLIHSNQIIAEPENRVISAEETSCKNRQNIIMQIVWQDHGSKDPMVY